MIGFGAFADEISQPETGFCLGTVIAFFRGILQWLLYVNINFVSSKRLQM